MEEIVERENLKEALRRVKANKGAPGVDGITVDQLGDYLKQHWPTIREQLLNGTYIPKPVKRVASRIQGRLRFDPSLVFMDISFTNSCPRRSTREWCAPKDNPNLGGSQTVFPILRS